MKSRRRATGRCDNCGGTFSMEREWQKFCSVKCRNHWHTVGEPRACTYCGEPADTQDHFPCKADREKLEAAGLGQKYPYHMVNCCRECNCGLGARPLWTLAQRRRFVAKWLTKRYRRYLNAPDWTDADLGTLGDGLQRYVIHRQAIKELARARIEYATKPHR